MLGRFRSVLYNAIGTLDAEQQHGQQDPGGGPATAAGGSSGQGSSSGRAVKYAYQRPVFLQLFTEDEVQVTADHLVRPIMVPRDMTVLPWFAGYAEAINAGKSVRNEDQAAFHRGVLRTSDLDLDPPDLDPDGDLDRLEIPYVYFGMFDGHAGSGCAVAAANDLHQVLHFRLMEVLRHLVLVRNPVKLVVAADRQSSSKQAALRRAAPGYYAAWHSHKEVTVESLVTGALEAAFWDLDQQIGEDKRRFKMLGGCTALVALFIMGKLYVANAGDSRGVLCRNRAARPMSYDFTPVSERQRLQQLGFSKPHLLGSEYTHLDFHRKPMREDLGKRMLYRDAHMTGWSYKKITEEDLKFPVVFGEGKRSRLLATIGVTRGFGDHDLRAQSVSPQGVPIKPFLTPQPEVRVMDVENDGDVGESDVLVLATDGLWDVLSNDRVADIVESGMNVGAGGDNHQGAAAPSSRKKVLLAASEEVRKKYRFISIAQELVMAARGKLVNRSWQRSVPSGGLQEDDGAEATPGSNGVVRGDHGQQGCSYVAATIDDISVFVIPILPYKEEYSLWKDSRTRSVAPAPASNGSLDPAETEDKALRMKGTGDATRQEDPAASGNGLEELERMEEAIDAMMDRELQGASKTPASTLLVIKDSEASSSGTPSSNGGDDDDDDDEDDDEAFDEASAEDGGGEAVIHSENGPERGQGLK